MSSTRNQWPNTCQTGGASASPFPSAEAVIAVARRRQRRRRRRRRAMLAASLVVMTAVAAGAIGLSSQTRRAPAAGHSQSPPPTAAEMPPQIVVWTDNFRIEDLSARTGRLIRTLATNVALYRGVPTIAVSRDGIVYFDTARNRRQWVMSVPLTGGRPTTVAVGYSPAISPNGRLLAYVAWTDCLMPCVSAPEAIVVRDLSTGGQRRWRFTSVLTDIGSLSWAPDNRHLAFAATAAVKHATVSVQTAQVLDTSSGGTLDSAPAIPLGQRVAWSGYLTASTGVGVMLGPSGVLQFSRGLVEVGVKSGRVLAHLSKLPPGGLAVGNAVDGTEGTITADRTGRYLLIAGQRKDGSSELFRWTFGMPYPVAVVNGALKAAWAG